MYEFWVYALIATVGTTGGVLIGAALGAHKLERLENKLACAEQIIKDMLETTGESPVLHLIRGDE